MTELDNHAAQAPDRHWVWFSSVESANARKISVLALAETFAMVGVYGWVAVRFGTLPLVISASLTPLLLLRTEHSVGSALKWIVRFGAAPESAVSEFLDLHSPSPKFGEASFVAIFYPWRRLRTMTLGWNVRFTGSLLIVVIRRRAQWAQTGPGVYNQRPKSSIGVGLHRRARVENRHANAQGCVLQSRWERHR